MALVPRGCFVSSIELDGRGRAEVRYRCADDRGQHEYRSRDRAGNETIGNYPHKIVKATSVSFRGVHVHGAARLGFVLSPAHAVCSKSGREISCRLVGDTSGSSLQGARKRRRRH